MNQSSNLKITLLICIALIASSSDGRLVDQGDTIKPFEDSSKLSTGWPPQVIDGLLCGVSHSNFEKNVIEAAKIINGSNAKPGQFPWQVRLEIDTDYGTINCGAVLVGKRTILTAAHCVQRVSDNEDRNLTDGSILDIIAYLGDYSKSNEDGELAIGISQIFVHPQYTKEGHYDDIAIVMTIKPIDYKITDTGFGSVNRVCIPERDSKPEPGESMIISGWGYSKFGDVEAKPDVLQTTKVKLLDDLECKKRWGNYDPEKQVCVADEMGYTSPCMGDSGGPLIHLMDDNRYELVGLVSYGDDLCKTNKASVFTRVSHYIPRFLSESNFDSPKEMSIQSI